ncbi:polysaccharide deacetylase family protein [Streptomyces sp. 891-h]|uniref:polysaccharide deacetylase family protein n=1 Tax=unclassified Streptomyces TaxID=2593676 RepID=UPI001FAB1ECD|nr:polysaccharide deacetylase family protein [Streptomyces sp. 891-h]UNZ17722.1 polysaccharide deacetylase family protein [Streptomyces sp. 891-h]
MRSDSHIVSRRALLCVGLGVGTATVMGVGVGFLTHQGTAGGADPGLPHGAGDGPATASASASAPAAGGAAPGKRSAGRAPSLRRATPDSYRLRPLAGETSMGEPAAHPPVRTHAETRLPSLHGRHVMALTFDDGPHPEHTPRLLEVLRRHGVQATFFVVGQNAAAFPGLLHAIAADGHVVGNHSYTHRQLPRLPSTEVRSELSRTSELIDRVVGTPPRWCRAPYGDWHPPSLKICSDLGMEPMGWSLDTRDWARPGTASIVRAVTEDAFPGAIVLQHDGGGPRQQTVAAVDRYLPLLQERGFTCVRPQL